MSEKLNIAFITDTFLPHVSGIATYIMIISKELADNGHQVTIYTYKKAINPFRNENVNVVRLHSVELPTYSGIHMCVPNPVSLLKSISRLNQDIIHIHSPTGPLSVTALAIAKHRGIPAVATFHGFMDKYDHYMSFFRMMKWLKIPFGSSIGGLSKAKIPVKLKNAGVMRLANLKIKKRLVWRVLRAMYNKCDAVIVPSPLSAKEVRSHGISCLSIPHGIDADTFRRKASYKRKNRILSVCRLGYEKNIDVVLRAFSLVAGLRPNVKLTIVGDGPARKSLMELAKNLGLEESVSFPGTVERSGLQEYFDSHDFFVNASDSETFGYVIAEAMAAGLPIVAVKAQGTTDLVKHGINGLLVEPYDVRGFAEAMEKMLEGRTTARKFGKASVKLVKKFSVEKCYEGHIRLYKRLLKTGKQKHL